MAHAMRASPPIVRASLRRPEQTPTGPLSGPRLLWLLRQVAGSLDEAHRIGLIHRDIKPDNIMVCDRGGICDVVKVLDFGLVKEMQSSEPALSQAHAVVGTPLYMAPESITSPDTVGVASDIYAFGAVAYYLAAGRHVFQAKTMVEICAHHIRTPPEPIPGAAARALPTGMESLILACLAKQAKDRPASADALERALSAMMVPSTWNARRCASVVGRSPGRPRAIARRANDVQLRLGQARILRSATLAPEPNSRAAAMLERG